MNFHLLIFFILLALVFVLAPITFYLFIVYGQEPEAVVTPTPVPTPTPTSPDPNLQYLPQKAYVQAYAPEQGIPSNGQPYQVVPQTVATAPVQSQSIGGFDINNLLSIIMGSGIGGAVAKFLDRKTEKTTQSLAQNQVKIAEVQEEALNLQYDNMPQKGNEVTNKPVIKQDNVKQIKEDAIDTAAKA